MLYLGNYRANHKTLLAPLTYQALWGLKSKVNPDRRAVIGKTILFPLLKQYPEDEKLQSLTSRPAFKVLHLNQF